jgi:uncharacterized Ntn-hydrolase superfamily protein
MTFSILAHDLSTGEMGGAAATGSLCVGGWVLRGDSRAGMSASQGASPSSLWGENALCQMQAGDSADKTLAAVTNSDAGREWRQMALLDRFGRTACFTGENNTAWRGSLVAPGLVVSGNLLAGPQVLAAMRDAFVAAQGRLTERLLAALSAAERAGGDTRGLQSAALLVVCNNTAPLTLRVDWAEDPIAALCDLHKRSQSGDYAAWLPTVPTRNDPERYDA